MKQVQYLLVVPSGSRRHARREFLRDLLHEGSDRFDVAIQWLEIRDRPHVAVFARLNLLANLRPEV